MASGCKMHRTPESQKCKFLPLGKWRNTMTQTMIPLPFFTLSNQLGFLGKTQQANPTGT